MHPGWWCAALSLCLAAQGISSVRWRWLARRQGFDRPLWKFAGYYLIGMFFNLLLPTSIGGDVVRAWYLDGRSGRRGAALACVVTDRLGGLVVLLVLACVAVLASPTPIPAWVSASVGLAASGAFVGLALLPRLAELSLWNERWRRLLVGLRAAIGLVVQPWPALLSLVVQVLNVVLVWCLARAVAAEVPLTYCGILVPMVSLLTLLPVSLNGMGVREGFTVLYLAHLGVPTGTALTLALLWFAVFAAVGAAGGLVYLAGSFPRVEVEKDHESLGHHSDQGRTRQSAAAA
jgi:uncharacterized membrane protein YbhN (UPF0104 family)